MSTVDWFSLAIATQWLTNSPCLIRLFIVEMQLTPICHYVDVLFFLSCKIHQDCQLDEAGIVTQ